MALKMLIAMSLFFACWLEIDRIYLQMLANGEKINGLIAIEAKVLERIKREFYEFKEEDFKLRMQNTEIAVHYDGLEATIEAQGDYNFKSCLKYNDDYGTVDEYYYFE